MFATCCLAENNWAEFLTFVLTASHVVVQFYILRKLIEHELGEKQVGEDDCYICSLSSRVLVYKGQLTPGQVSSCRSAAFVILFLALKDSAHICISEHMLHSFHLVIYSSATSQLHAVFRGQRTRDAGVPSHQ